MNTQNKYNKSYSYFILKNKKNYEYEEGFYYNDIKNLIQEIHYSLENDEITNITIFLKENVEQLLKELFTKQGNAARQKIDTNTLTLETIYIDNYATRYEYNKEIKNILDKHTQGKIFNYLKTKQSIEEQIKTSIQNNNTELTFKYYKDLQNLKIPSLDNQKNLSTIQYTVKEFKDIPNQIDPQTKRITIKE